MKNELKENVGSDPFSDLLEHNQRPAREIFEYFKSGLNKVLYVSGVGTGKSYVSNCIIQALGAEKVAYIIPKLAIRDDIKRRLSNMDVDFYTYNYFSTVDIGLDALVSYDLVIVDEAHHIGSDTYGLNLISIMDQLTGTKFLGLTATPDRDSDGVNVGIFFDKTVNGITVMDAQRAGLMPQYEYITCNPNIEEIKKANKDNKKLVIDFDNSEELLADIIQNNMRNKWIVYYSSIRQMNQGFDLIQRLFPEYEILRLDSRQRNLDDAIELMYSDKKCVIMSCSILLEGVHVPEVSGIILFRNISSLTVFDQILGRVSKIGGNIQPVVIDCTDTATRMFKKLQKSDNDARVIGNGFFREIGVKRDAYYISLANAKYINLQEMIEKYAGTKTVCGYTFKNDADLSRQLGKGKSYVSGLRNKEGMSYEDIILLATRDTTQTVCGYTFKNDMDLSKQLGKGQSYVSYFRIQGKTYEEIIHHVVDDHSQTVLGYTFKSSSDLSRQLGKNVGYVSNLLSRGLSYKQIIEQAVGHSQTILGYTFKSDADLAKQLGKSASYVYQMKKKGFSYEEIIHNIVSDHSRTVLGYTFKNDVDLSRQLGKEKNYVCYLRKRNLSYEDIIRHAIGNVQTILGYTFKDNTDLSIQLGKGKGYVNRWKNKGYSYEDIIKKAIQSQPKTVLGYTFKSDADLSRQLGRSVGYINNLLNKGLSYEEIISSAKAS